MSARDTILSRVREALADVPDDERPADVAVPRDYRRTSRLPDADVLDLFVRTVEEYGAAVHRVEPDTLAAAVRAVCQERRIRSMAAAAGFPEHLVTGAGVVLMRDSPPMSAGSLNRADAVITTAAVGIAETGTIALGPGSGMGRRALSLVPDTHVCLVRADQVVATVPEALDRLAPQADRPITLVSGGSATSDIELVRVEGVHGPRVLEVILVESPTDGDSSNGPDDRASPGRRRAAPGTAG